MSLRTLFHAALAATFILTLTPAFAETKKPAAPAAKPAAKAATPAAKPAPKPVAKPAAPAAAKPKAAAPAAAKAPAPAAKPAKGTKGAKGKGKSVEVKAPPADKPIWTYRTHYTFSGSTLSFDNAQDNGEWRMYQDEHNILGEPFGFEITLADGKKIGNAQMVLDKSDRALADDTKFGPGTKYDNRYQPVNGLRVTQRVMKYKERPFLSVRLELENTTQQPIQVARIAPLNAAPGALTGLSADVEVHTHRVVNRGGFLVRDGAHVPVMTRFTDKAKKIMLLIGVVDTSHGAVACEFKKEGNSWAGEAVTAYAPAITIAPGATLESDAVLLDFITNEPHFTDQYYSWAIFTGLHKATVAEGPKSWVTVAPGESFDALKDAAAAWHKHGVRYAMVRAGMKGKFNELQQQIGRGTELGIELDPLDADGASGDGIIEGPDGKRWLNPTTDAAKKYLKKRVETLQSKDCAFIVIGDTTVPAEVLAKIGLPREAAVALATEVIVSASDKMFFFGMPGAQVDVVPGLLEELKPEVMNTAIFGAWPSPLAVHFTGDLDGQLDEAQKIWPGPLVLTGKPN